jgi:hypothetical protein
MGNDTILVQTADTTAVRGRGPRELEVEVLSDNMSQFLTQIGSTLEKAPEDVSGFKITEFEVSAEISADGRLSLVGTGIGVAAKGGLTFRFQRQP